MNLLALVSQTVAAVAPASVPVVLVYGSATVRTRGVLRSVESEDQIFMSRDGPDFRGVVAERAIRVPIVDLPAPPAHQQPILVDGVQYRVQSWHERGPVYLVGLERVAARPAPAVRP